MIAAMCVVSMCFAVGGPVFAADSTNGQDEETSKDAKDVNGSITVQLKDGDAGTKKSGVVFSYTKVAEIENGDPVMLEAYKSVDLLTAKTTAELQNAAKALEKIATPDGKVTTDANGTAKIEKLDSGAYLISCADRADYDITEPMIVTIPTWDNEKSDMDFDLVVSPKHSPVPRSPKMGEMPFAAVICAVNVTVAIGICAAAIFYPRRTRIK